MSKTPEITVFFPYLGSNYDSLRQLYGLFTDKFPAAGWSLGSNSASYDIYQTLKHKEKSRINSIKLEQNSSKQALDKRYQAHLKYI